MGLLTLLEVIVIIALVYVLPIVHVIRSDRTPPKMRWFFCVVIAVMGLLGYLMWWMMTTPPQNISNLDPKTLPAFPVAPNSDTALLYVLRSGFFGALVTYRVFLDDDRITPIAQIQGSRYATAQISPGKHTLWVKSYRWLEFPFEAQAGQVLAFSLDTQTETPLTNTVGGWLDELNARRRLARLRA